MSKAIWNFLQVTPAIVGLSLFASNAVAQNVPETNVENTNGILEQIESYNNDSTIADPTMGQVNSISQLRDVSPTDWAYQALRNLVEEYDCIEGYPNRTYRGDRALTRYEFAAGLNACLEKIGSLDGDYVTQEEFDQLKRLVDQFQPELEALGARVDSLEARVDVLEDNQFSTTTKLKGEAVFTLANQFGDNVNNDDHTIFGDRVRLTFDTSFNGDDQLATILESGNLADGRFNTFTNMTRLSHDDGNANDTEIYKIWYNFKAGDDLKLWVAPLVEFNDIASSVYNPYMASSSTGALSRFMRRNPAVYRLDVERQALAANWQLSDNFGVDLAYLAGAGENPGQDMGFFNGSYAGVVQLNWDPSENLGLGFTYAHSYHDRNQTGARDIDLTGNTGSQIGDAPFGGTPTSADRFGLQGNWEISDRFNLAAWGGYVDAQSETTNQTAELWNWASTLSVLDLWKDGAVLNFGGGMLPHMSRTGGTIPFASDDTTSYLVEANYFYPINKNISITPGVYVVLDPEGTDTSEIWVGAIRTTFKF